MCSLLGAAAAEVQKKVSHIFSCCVHGNRGLLGGKAGKEHSSFCVQGEARRAGDGKLEGKFHLGYFPGLPLLQTQRTSLGKHLGLRTPSELLDMTGVGTGIQTRSTSVLLLKLKQGLHVQGLPGLQRES